jgi:hypothetical protein
MMAGKSLDERWVNTYGDRAEVIETSLLPLLFGRRCVGKPQKGSVSAAICNCPARQAEPANVESGVMCLAGQVGSGLSTVSGN